jgi:hypothetical protein
MGSFCQCSRIFEDRCILYCILYVRDSLSGHRMQTTCTAAQAVPIGVVTLYNPEGVVFQTQSHVSTVLYCDLRYTYNDFGKTVLHTFSFPASYSYIYIRVTPHVSCDLKIYYNDNVNSVLWVMHRCDIHSVCVYIYGLLESALYAY